MLGAGVRPGAPSPYSLFSLSEVREERLGFEPDRDVRDLAVSDGHLLHDVIDDGLLVPSRRLADDLREGQQFLGCSIEGNDVRLDRQRQRRYLLLDLPTLGLVLGLVYLLPRIPVPKPLERCVEALALRSQPLVGNVAHSAQFITHLIEDVGRSEVPGDVLHDGLLDGCRRDVRGVAPAITTARARASLGGELTSELAV